MISWPYLRQLQSSWQTTERTLSTYLALGWWSACLVFDVLLAPTVLAIRAGAPGAAAWGLTGALALGLGADAVLGRPRLCGGGWCGWRDCLPRWMATASGRYRGHRLP